MAAWVVPPNSASADLQLGGVVFFKWRRIGGDQGEVQHLGIRGPQFGGYKERCQETRGGDGGGIEG